MFMRSKKGFSLLEVMVAVAMLALCLTVLLGSSISSMRRSGRAEKLLVATMLARQKMADLEIEIEKGKVKGEFPEDKSEEDKFEQPFEDYSWKMQIRKVDLPAPVTGEKGSLQDTVGRQLTKEISQTVREMKLIVTWKERGEDQNLELVTHIVKM